MSTPEELTVNYTDNGIQTVKELDKEILTRGAWTTILFRFQEWEAARNAYGGDKYAIRRYQKRGGEYQMKSKFNISSREQAAQIVAVLNRWMAEE